MYRMPNNVYNYIKDLNKAELKTFVAKYKVKRKLNLSVESILNMFEVLNERTRDCFFEKQVDAMIAVMLDDLIEEENS